MITLVGVGHVFQLRQRIEALVRNRHPDLVCIELDEDLASAIACLESIYGWAFP